MALSEVTTIQRRTVDDELRDMEYCRDNMLKESWKEWPNEAAFEGLEEHRGPIAMKIKGTIPAWAAGSLYRTGPGVSAIENTSRGTHYVSHWFDGFAHTHKFDIVAPDSPGAATQVNYSSRRQSEDYINLVKKKGWRANISFGQRADPCIGVFSKVMSVFNKNQASNNNVVILPNFSGLQDKAPSGSGHRTATSNLYVSTDSATMQEVHPDTLEPLGHTDQTSLHPSLKGPFSCAHAQRDAVTGDWYNFNLDLGRVATYRIFRVNAATGKTEVLATIAKPNISPAYIHSFFLTDNYVVVCIPSSHYGWAGIKVLRELNMLDAMKPFDKTAACRWIVVDRRGDKGVVAHFSTPASFFFHSVNAFEETIRDEKGVERTQICLDYVRYDTTDILQSLYYDVILDRNGATKDFFTSNSRLENCLPHLVRYSFCLPRAGEVQTAAEAAKATAKETISIPAPHAGDLPTINPKYACKQHRYVYGVTTRGLSSFLDSLVKTDMKTREAMIWTGGKGHSPGEPIFVPRPGAEDEDDGVLLSVVLDGTAQHSYLVCLDARTLEELGRAEAEFPIAMGFHGHHAPVVGQQENGDTRSHL